MPQTNHGSIEFIKFPNPQFPGDQTKLIKKWLRDSWARRKIVALQQAVASIVVPTRTSQLTNDSGYITQADVPPGSTASTTTPLMDGTAAVGTENAFARGDHRHPSDTNKADKATTLAGYGITNAYTKTEVDGMIPTVPTKTSDLTNDSDFQTGTQVGNAISAEAGLMVPYGYCTTGASTVAKVVTVSPAVTELTTGLTIAVKFQYANTGSNPTLNVNGLGAKAIKRYGTTAAGTSAAANWNANSVVILTYDGTYWMLADWNNTTYSGMTDAEYQAGTGTSNRLITPARLKAAIELHAPVQSVNGQTGAVTIAVPTKTSDLTNDSGFITGYTETDPTVPAWAKASTKPSYTASEVGALPNTTAIPSKTSDLTNDSGFITGYTETDPTVPSWAKASSKPTYTAAEVGALPSSTVIPSKTSDLTNDSGFITGYTETDPTVPAWAKATSKPSYTASEVLTTAQLAAVNSGITADDLAIDNASVLCTVTPIEPTLSAGEHYDTFGRCWYYKIGHRVHVHIGVSGLTANTTTTLWTMPAGYRPYSSVSFTGQSSSYSNIARCRVLENGEVRVNAASTYATAYMEFDAFA